MKLAIVGSRSFEDYELMKNFILSHFNIDEITDIVSGGARGADRLGERFAKEFHENLIVFKADWDKYGKRAGFIRNVDIIKTCDKCVCFWDGDSNGTKHDIDLCKEMDKPCLICKF